MKKTCIIALILLLTVNAIAFAQDDVKFETVDYKESNIQNSTEQIVCGNQICFKLDMSSATIPENRRYAGFTNSPMYVYDKDMNFLKTVEFEGYRTVSNFLDGFFYILDSIYIDEGDKIITEKKYYKTADCETLQEINFDEYYIAVNSYMLYNNSIYTKLQKEYVIGDNIVDKGEYNYFLKESNRQFPIIYENDNIKIISKSLSECMVVLIKNNTDISLDGLNFFPLPRNADVKTLCASGEYVYISQSEDFEVCYRISVMELMNVVKVKYNDSYLSFDYSPVTENDRTLIPMRFLFEQMGAEVSWDETTNTATVSKASDVVSFSIDNTVATVNAQPKTMDVPARLINNKTYIPLRFLSEELGYTVEWDEGANTVIITE